MKFSTTRAKKRHMVEYLLLLYIQLKAVLKQTFIRHIQSPRRELVYDCEEQSYWLMNQSYNKILTNIKTKINL